MINKIQISETQTVVPGVLKILVARELMLGNHDYQGTLTRQLLNINLLLKF